MRTSPLLVVKPLDLRGPKNSYYRATSHISSLDIFGGSGSAICTASRITPTFYFSSACSRQLGGDDQSMVKGSEDKLKSYFAQSTGRQRRRDGSSPSESQARSTVNRLTDSKTQNSPLTSLSSDRGGPNVDSSKIISSPSQRSITNSRESRGAFQTLAKAASESKGQHGELDNISDHGSDCSTSSRSTRISIASSVTSVASTYPERVWKQKKKELVDKLMIHFFAYFRPWIETNFGIESCSDGEHQGGSCSENSQSAGQGGTNSNNKSTASRKRQQRHSSGEGGEMNPTDDEDNKGNGGRRNNKRARQDKEDAQQRRFACPYYKNSPQAFKNYRTCRMGGFATTARLKEHLYRNHTKPEYQCNRCLEDLGSDQELENHQRLDNACVKKTSKKDTRLSRAQVQDLKAKKPSLSEHQRWEDIYGKIFPGEPLPKSPYCDGELTELENLGEFLDKEFPPLYREVLENEVDLMMGGLEAELKDRLVNKVPSLFRKLLEEYCHQNSLNNQHHRDGDSKSPLPRACRDSNTNTHSTAESYGMAADRTPHSISAAAPPLGNQLSNIDFGHFASGGQFFEGFHSLMDDIGEGFENNGLRSTEKVATKDFLDWLAGEGVRLEVGHGHLEPKGENEWRFTNTRGIAKLAILIRSKWNQVGVPPDIFLFFHHTVLNRAIQAFAARQLTINRISHGDMEYASHKYATQKEAHDKHVFFLEQLAGAVLILVQGWFWAE
ncbi:uncharacterized protein PpBr36_06420 [Pyricularia pennisetigena]|uniref:uncharacterized protein n=1 Tax=Pyricularia pennisetigena TaxID=1578925 RepID=UPI0011545384|nr:uncharacterized protein PpBr36_06420 [Pyricularia pennisetigena]TLS23408.1 hypothetical protein PpBr36_06420 [Pyricularia pennisetigena]